MELFPRTETLKTALSESPDRLKALLLWFHADQGNAPEEFQNFLEEVQTLDVDSSYRLLESLDTAQAVHYSLINEFGSRFTQKTCFNLLQKLITERLQQQAMNLA